MMRNLQAAASGGKAHFKKKKKQNKSQKNRIDKNNSFLGISILSHTTHNFLYTCMNYKHKQNKKKIKTKKYQINSLLFNCVCAMQCVCFVIPFCCLSLSFVYFLVLFVTREIQNHMVGHEIENNTNKHMSYFFFVDTKKKEYKHANTLNKTSTWHAIYEYSILWKKSTFLFCDLWVISFIYFFFQTGSKQIKKKSNANKHIK